MRRVIVGGICVDHLLTVSQIRVGAKHRIDSPPRTTIGGGAANHAMATAWLAPDRELLLFALVGNDDMGLSIRRTFQQSRIEMPLEPCDDLPTSESFIISETDFDGRGTIVSVPGARIRELPMEQIRESLRDAEALCLCAPATNTQIDLLLDAARAACVPAYFALGSAQIDGLSYDALEDQLESSAELVICNHAEATRLTGTQDVKAQLRALRFSGRVRTSVVTCGAEGLWGFDNLRYRHEPAYQNQSRPIVNDTGAGDAAAAAIVDSLLRGLPLDESLACGARNGFEACTGYALDNVCARAHMEIYLESRRRMAA